MSSQSTLTPGLPLWFCGCRGVPVQQAGALHRSDGNPPWAEKVTPPELALMPAAARGGRGTLFSFVKNCISLSLKARGPGRRGR